MAEALAHRAGQRPGYGIDAPGLVKGFFVAGVFALAVGLAVGLSPWPGGVVAAAVALLAGLAAAYALGMGCYMLHGSLVGKVRARDRLLDLVPWSGAEAVLDVGCGRGLLLVAAARRAPLGRAVGVDLWQAEDQSGNRPEAALANAQAEGVAERVEVRTADARELPFPDGSFDVVVSHWVVHNLHEPAERARVLAEMARVLKPGGWVLVADIANHAEYAGRLRALGLVGVRQQVSRFGDAVRLAISFGSFRPGVVVGQKPAEPRAAPEQARREAVRDG
jgi:ubiquinone/menaquinone biosynthesis C-methylase UbiE